MVYRIRTGALVALPAALTALVLGACSTGIDPTLGIASNLQGRAAPTVEPTVLSVPAPGTVETMPLEAASKVARLGPELIGPDGTSLATHYAARTVDGITVPAVDPTQLSADHLRAVVLYSGTEEPGSIVIGVQERHLYLVQDGGTAIRYGIAVGREGFGWTGTEKLTRTAKWPTWTPPTSMIEREPELEKWVAGMPGSADNPLGARALYLGDTLYRIHGTNKPYSIGKAASSGCFRMTNQDVLDLYERVRPGATVYVRQRLPTVVASN